MNSRLEIQSYWVLLVASWSISNRAVFTWASNRKRLFVLVFSRLALGACNCFEFWLVHCLVRVVCDWLEWLFWFWDTRSETTRSENWTNWTSQMHLIKYGINSGRSLVSLSKERISLKGKPVYCFSHFLSLLKTSGIAQWSKLRTHELDSGKFGSNTSQNVTRPVISNNVAFSYDVDWATFRTFLHD